MRKLLPGTVWNNSEVHMLTSLTFWLWFQPLVSLVEGQVVNKHQMQSWLELLASDQWRLAGQLGLFLALVMDRCSLATALVTIMLSHTLLTMSPGPPPIDQTWSQRMRSQHGVIPKISVHSHKMAVKHKIYKSATLFCYLTVYKMNF